MRTAFLLSATALAGCSSLPGIPGPGPTPLFPDHGDVRTVEIRNFIGRLEIEEARFFKVDDRTLRIGEMRGRDLIVDAGHAPDTALCEVVGDEVHLTHPGWGGRVEIGDGGRNGDLDQLPVVRVKAGGRNIRLVVRNSILFGEAGDLAEMDLEMKACGRLDIGDVEDKATLHLAGDVRVDFDDTERLDARMAGRAFVYAERITETEAALSDATQLRIEDAGRVRLGLDAMSRAQLGEVRVLAADVSQTATLRARELMHTSMIRQTGVSRVDIEASRADAVELHVGGQSEARIGGETSLARLTTTDRGLIDIHEVSDALIAEARDRSEIRIARDPETLKASRIGFGGVRRFLERVNEIPSLEMLLDGLFD